MELSAGKGTKMHEPIGVRIRLRGGATLCASLLVTACAGTSTIQPAATTKSQFDSAVFGGENTTINRASPGVVAYRLFQQAATGFVSLETVRASTERRATDFCARSGKQMRTLSETASKPPHILGNFPRVEVVFECADASTAISSGPGAPDGKYARVEKLKALLDDGALTQAEFDREKAKVLNGP